MITKPKDERRPHAPPCNKAPHAHRSVHPPGSQNQRRIAGLSVAIRGLIAARIAVMTAVAAIDADMRRMTRASAACRRLMTIPGVGQLTALAFVATIDDPSRIRRSRDVGAYLGLVPRRYQSGEVDYVGGISRCGIDGCGPCCTKPPTSC